MRLTLLTFFISISAFAQQNLFDQYHYMVTTKKLTSSEAITYLGNSERQFFKEIAIMFDDIKFDDSQMAYLSAKDNFNDAKRIWTNHNQEVKLKKTLQKIIKDPKSVVKNSETISILKTNRKYAHILRESFYLFDINHKAPDMLENIVKPFGKLNDAIVVTDKKLIKKYAKEVLENYEKLNLKNLSKAFKPVTTDEFFKNIKDIKNEITKIFEKEITTPHDFHTLRKQYKRFLYVYHSLDDYISHEKFIKLDRFISKIGELNDIYTDMKFRFGIDIKAYELSFPKNFKLEILNSLHYLEEDIAPVKLVKSCGSFFLPRL